jgi:MFS family permease
VPWTTTGRRLLLDVRPLRRSADFRRLFLGSVVSSVGGQMTTFAVALQVFRITGSSAAVGGVGLAAGVPSIVVGFLGGPLIDAVDRRRLVLVMTGGLSLISAAFAAQAIAGLSSVGLLYALVFVQYLLTSVNGPARRTFVPRLLEPRLLPAGAALQMFAMRTSLVLGPPLAGLLTAHAGLRTCYLVDAVSFLASLYAVARLPAMRPDGVGSGRGPRAILDGLRFIGGHQPLLGALLSDLSATALAFPLALFPAINAERFGGSPQTLGLLTAALAAGGILGTAFSGPVSSTRHQGRAITVATFGWGAALIGFGLVRGLGPTLGCLVAAGAADVLSVVFRTALVQTATPDRYRGRVSAAEYVVGVGAVELGNFRAGVLGSLTTPSLSAVIGGGSSLVGAAAVALAPPACAATARRNRRRRVARDRPAARPGAGRRRSAPRAVPQPRH